MACGSGTSCYLAAPHTADLDSVAHLPDPRQFTLLFQVQR
jgi:hypothetical protein